MLQVYSDTMNGTYRVLGYRHICHDFIQGAPKNPSSSCALDRKKANESGQISPWKGKLCLDMVLLIWNGHNSMGVCGALRMPHQV